MERKLTAILAADVAGYSRLMGVDEEGTLNALRAHREVVDGLIVAHRGRVFSSAGDSIVAEFPSAVEALNCAVEVQQERRGHRGHHHHAVADTAFKDLVGSARPIEPRASSPRPRLELARAAPPACHAALIEAALLLRSIT